MSDTVAWLSAGIAAVSAGVAVWQAIAAGRARRAATQSADDASRAATDSAVALTKLSELAQEDAARIDPPWRIEHRSGDTYRVVNDGRDTCRAVSIEPAGSPYKFNGHEPSDVHSRAGKEFTMMVQGGAPPLDRRVVVRWQIDRHPDPMKWVGDIPARPQRR